MALKNSCDPLFYGGLKDVSKAPCAVRAAWTGENRRGNSGKAQKTVESGKGHDLQAINLFDSRCVPVLGPEQRANCGPAGSSSREYRPLRARWRPTGLPCRDMRRRDGCRFIWGEREPIPRPLRKLN